MMRHYSFLKKALDETFFCFHLYPPPVKVGSFHIHFWDPRFYAWVDRSNQSLIFFLSKSLYPFITKEQPKIRNICNYVEVIGISIDGKEI